MGKLQVKALEGDSYGIGESDPSVKLYTDEHTDERDRLGSR